VRIWHSIGTKEDDRCESSFIHTSIHDYFNPDHDLINFDNFKDEHFFGLSRCSNGDNERLDGKVRSHLGMTLF